MVGFAAHKWGRALVTPAPWRPAQFPEADRSGNGIDVPAPRKRRPAVRKHDGPPDHKESGLPMADANPTDCTERDLCGPDAEDTKVERIVLAFLLEEHPTQLTIPEVSLALNAHPGSFSSDDAVERAVRELVGAGLLYCQDRFVLPARAALYFARLEAD